MAEQIAVNIAEKAVESLISQIWQEIQYLFNYNSNIKKLREKVEDLERKKDAVQRQADVAERNAQVIEPDVLEWLKKVDNIKKEGNQVLERTMNAQLWCFYCKCPKLPSRYKLSKRASRMTSEVIELQDASKFERIGYATPTGQMPFISPHEIVGFESRMTIRNDVMEALKDDSITIIGICGMAGVGKTTLVKEIADKVKAVNLFDEVAMAVVSNDLVVANIQDQLAANLGLRFEEKTDHRRAERLYTRLMNKDKRILVILDDLWKELDIRNIGIPVESERGGLKVLLTSRYEEVCSDMRATTFEVEVLSKEESWHLFKETAEISEEANDIKDIAEEVEKECGGLPLAIVTVGKALKNKKDHVWREALQQLKETSMTSIRGMKDLVYSRIKLSYEYLENVDSKLLLLLCSLFPEDYNIPLEDLVRYAKGLQLFKNVKPVARARDKVYTITDELKSCHLLLEGDKEKCVKLHDIVQDVCLSIASTDEHMYMVRHGRLKEWPQEDSYALYTAISLTFDKIDQFPSGLEYPKLKLLQFIFQEHKLHIPEDFFKGMKELNVLQLFNLNSELLSSLQFLVNLKVLCLENCRLYGHISVFRSLKELEILSFYSSYLEHFPDEIVELSNLKSLDLRFKKGPPLPSGVLLSLKRLEDLYLGSYFQEWKSKGEEAYSVIISEVSSLQNLQTFQFCAYDDYCLERVLEKLHYEKLMRFKIARTIGDKGIGEFQFKNTLTLQSVNVDLLKKRAVQALLWKSEDFTLRVDGLTNLVNELDGEGFVNLQKLNLESCDLKYLVDVTNSLTSGGTFINLEELVIRNANNLEELCHGNLPLGSFAKLREVQLVKLPALRHLWGAIQHPCLSNLRILKLTSCGLVKSLILKSSLKCLSQLQQISIEDCPVLEAVISNEEEDEKDSGNVELPKLDRLKLYDLKSFRSFGAESGLEASALFKKVTLANLETLEITTVNNIRCIVDHQMPIGSLSKLRTIEVYDCDGLVHVASSDSIKLLQNLERLHVICCRSLEVVFDFTGLNVEGADIDSPFDRLQSLRLWSLHNLKHILRMLPEGIHAFKNLRSLLVTDCNNLRYLFSPSMAKMLVSLEIVVLKGCEQMEEMIRKDEREILEIESEEEIVKEKKDGEENTYIIHFPKLRRLRLQNLDDFRMLCSQNVDLELPSLIELEISNCPKITKFCVGRLSATRLNNVHAKYYGVDDYKYEEKMVALDVFKSWFKDYESRIRCINCSFFEKERCNHLD